MSNPAILYTSLKSACERGTPSQLALDNALAKKRLTEAEYDELTAILDAALNPPPPPAPEPIPDAEAPTTSDGSSTATSDSPTASDEPAAATTETSTEQSDAQ